MTSAEERLWKELRREQLGFKFRRQFGVGHYILDFYCPQLKFAIELDGDVHAFDNVHRKDLVRDQFLKDCGITVKRYWNNEVFDNIDSVLEEIYFLCQQLKDNPKREQNLLDSPSKIRGRYRGS